MKSGSKEEVLKIFSFESIIGSNFLPSIMFSNQDKVPEGDL